MKKYLYPAWAVLFLLCAGLGAIPEPAGLMKVALVIVSLIFFAPAGFLLHNAYQEGDCKTIRQIRWISIGSLALTTLSLMAVVICGVSLNETALNIAYYVLLVLSSPMICSQYWFISLFLWAVLLCITVFKKVR